MLRDKFTWPVACEILDGQYDNCWLAKDGRLHGEVSSGRVSSRDFCYAHIDGYSLVVRQAEKAHVNFAQIAGEFGDSFDRPIDVQLYASPPGYQGFGWHFDYEEVFVVQTVGTKEFTIRRNSFWPGIEGNTQQQLFNKEHFQEEFKFVLRPGDWLYIPAGWWHKAQALSFSYHISVGVMFNDLRHEIGRPLNLIDQGFLSAEF